MPACQLCCQTSPVVKSQMTLDSFFPVFVFRLARPICSHPRGNVRMNYFFSFLFFVALKGSAKGKRDLSFLNVCSQLFGGSMEKRKPRYRFRQT